MRRWVIEYGWFAVMGAIIVALGFIAYELHQTNVHAAEANRNSAENNRILKSRDFDRLFTEHAEILERCAR